MGLFADVHYEVKKAKLEPGEMLVLYSDGVTEASNSHGDGFRRERVSRIRGCEKIQ